MRFVLVVHAASEAAEKVGSDAAERLGASGHLAELVRQSDETFDSDAMALVSEADLVVSLGGDGTMLRAVEAASPRSVPVLGVNLGTLGYLTTVEPHQLTESIDRFIRGDYTVEERVTLDVSVAAVDARGPLSDMPIALNEAVLERSVPGHTVRIEVSIGGNRFASYAADGLLVCSPTGSTAYNLSARGPILSPLLRALVVTPISPHMLFDRALVLGPEERVELEVLAPRPAVLVVDGIRVGALGVGSRVTVVAGPHPARLVSFGERDFHSILRAKFHLADR